eukprot:CAMPEP_0177579992 /NCGR_PEP_ID=MMETSP0419_2-20121207/1293_1 /TAXON_ID=582737 /ORGANISM="Tetraselmis sp., Strain GSL018" /LENGTH=70 /DNA_ID=CAMNT_0019068771 /DNA_START=289 /DNA_END=501 /DNA_ORIENTATION=+
MGGTKLSPPTRVSTWCPPKSLRCCQPVLQPSLCPSSTSVEVIPKQTSGHPIPWDALFPANGGLWPLTSSI